MFKISKIGFWFPILIVAIVMESCVSTQAPNNLNRAKKRVARHYEGIKNIVAKHPHIADSTRIVIRDTLIIKPIFREFDTSVGLDTAKFDSLLHEFSFLMARYDNSQPGMPDDTPIQMELQGNIQHLQNRLKELRNQLLTTATDSIADFVYEDENILFRRQLVGGTFRNFYAIKERKEAYDQTIIDTSLDVHRETLYDKITNFLGAFFFWALVLLVLYFVFRVLLKLLKPVP